MKPLTLSLLARNYASIGFWMLSIVFFASCTDVSELTPSSQEKVLLASSLEQNTSGFDPFIKKFVHLRKSNSLDKYIHPEMGFYVLHKPSAILVVEHFQDTEDMLTQLPHLESSITNFRLKDPQPQELPQYNCEQFSKRGMFYNTATDFDQIHTNLSIMSDFVGTPVSQEELQKAKTVDQKIQKILVSTEDYLELGFVEENGQWYLVWYNLAKYDCSA